MKTNKIFMLMMVAALSMFTVGCTESDELTDITPSKTQQQEEPTAQPLSDDISKTLSAIEGITDVQVDDCLEDGVVVGRYYTFFYDQFIDHSNKALGTFKQRVRICISNEGLTAPVVLYTHGYNMPDNIEEVFAPQMTEYLKASTMWVEHRYFAKSLPEPFENLEFTYLNADQAAQDLHAIVSKMKQTVFRQSGKWVSTGVSKDGITTGLYAYYSDKYGWDDIDLYMPFCAPFPECTPTSCDDVKLGQYLFKECGNNYPVGSQEQIAYQRIRKIPTALLQDKELRDACLRYYHQSKPDEYVYVINTFGRDEEKATAGLLYTYFDRLFKKFSYVNFYKWAALVPDVDAAIATATTAEEKKMKNQTITQLATFILMDATALSNYIDSQNGGMQYEYNSGDGESARLINEPMMLTDDDLLAMRAKDAGMPYYVQAARELGNTRLDLSTLDGLNFPGSTTDFGFLAASVAQQFEVSELFKRYAKDWDGGKLMKDFRQWVKTQNKYKMIFCYSANDPWTGGAIDESTNPKVKRFICRDGIHNDFFLKEGFYSAAEKQALTQMIDAYLSDGVEN